MVIFLTPSRPGGALREIQQAALRVHAYYSSLERTPLENISRMMERIGSLNFHQRAPSSDGAWSRQEFSINN